MDEKLPEDEVEVIKEIAEEARESFSLIEKLQNRQMRTAKITLGLDEVKSDQLAAIDALRTRLEMAILNASSKVQDPAETKKELAKLKRKLKTEYSYELEQEISEKEEALPVQSEAFEALQKLKATYDEQEGEADKIRAEVNKESYSLELRALPEVIVNGARRRARQTLGFKAKGVPEGREQDLEDETILEIAVDQTVRFRDNSTGEEKPKLTLDEVRAMRDFLPSSQSQKFIGTVMDLQFRNAISESAIAQADF